MGSDTNDRARQGGGPEDYEAVDPSACGGAGARVDLAAALDEAQSFLRRFVVLSVEQSCLVVLWIAQTHALAAFDCVAYVHISSPMPECGKTRLLEALEALVAKPWLTGRVSPAVLVRKTDREQPTLLLDESDAAFGGDKDYAEALRGVLNTGYLRSGTHSLCVGQGARIDYKDFSTFGPKAIAGIGTLPATIASRSIPIVLQRRTKAEPLTRWRRRAAWAEAEPVRGALLSAVSSHLDALTEAMTQPPDASGLPAPAGLSDRAEDVLEGLFALADRAGGAWPLAARHAGVALMGHAARVAQDADQSLGLELLVDVRAAFADAGDPEGLSTKDLLAALVAMDDRPWATLAHGHPLNPHRLARLLKSFGVLPWQGRLHGEKFRGYTFASFASAWDRYTPSPTPDPGFKPGQAGQANDYGPETAKTKAGHDPSVPLSKTAVHPMNTGLVPLVPLSTPDDAKRAAGDGRQAPLVPPASVPPDPPVAAVPPYGVSREAWTRHHTKTGGA